jgi:ferric-dicitrate binding protein FerR (iron transport regulator)
MKQSERIGLLMFKYLRDELSPEESLELNEWRYHSPENEEVFLHATDPETIREEITDMYKSRELVLQKIKERYPHLVRDSSKSNRSTTLWIISIAAILLIVFSSGWYFLGRRLSKTPKETSTPFKVAKDIKPGGNHAILTLANGSSILLDSVQNGVMTKEGSSSILKERSSQIVYTIDAIARTNEIRYNMLQTPRGGQYILVLSDGTKVWLNAATSIRYPVSFLGNERKVELNGEAYFEVAKNSNAPFKVITPSMDVEVLGTQFNVMAYNDEPIVATTLLEGKVKISKKNLNLEENNSKKSLNRINNKNEIVLQPGEQAQIAQVITHGEKALKGLEPDLPSIKVVKSVDANSIVAWKNGNTSFEHASIQEIMRAISRWYDVEVVFQGNIPDKKFVGGLPRNTELRDLLNVLEQSGVHFRVDGKKIIVTP